MYLFVDNAERERENDTVVSIHTQSFLNSLSNWLRFGDKTPETPFSLTSCRWWPEIPWALLEEDSSCFDKNFLNQITTLHTPHPTLSNCWLTYKPPFHSIRNMYFFSISPVSKWEIHSSNNVEWRWGNGDGGEGDTSFCLIRLSVYSFFAFVFAFWENSLLDLQCKLYFRNSSLGTEKTSAMLRLLCHHTKKKRKCKN